MKPIVLLVVSLVTMQAQTIAPEGYRGSVVNAQATSTPLGLSLQDAIDRGIKANIGLLVRGSDATEARAERLRALSALMPNVTGSASAIVAQNNLTTFGIVVPGFPLVVGPFNYIEARASVSSPVFDWALIKRVKAATENARAAQLSIDDGRDVVVEAVASGYFAILADVGRVEVTRNQLDLSMQLYQIAKDNHAAGVVPAIDELRANVETQKQQQTLLAVQNQLGKDKLALARVIGLPGGQEFEATEPAPYKALDGLSPDQLLTKAYQVRSDYKSTEAKVRASALSLKAADAARYPTLSLDGYYGDTGPTIGNSHGVFNVTGSLQFNIFDGGRIRADQETAGSILKRRQNDLDDLRGKIDYDVRNALLDLKTAADQVAIAKVSLDLAQETLNQARDRYVAGVGSGIELVDAQVSLAAANQDAISAAYAHNLAKVQLARAVGGTQTTLKEFLGDK
jgi:outer membrane protein TolC